MELIIPRPNEKQMLFLKAKQKYVGYGGARGGGKSWAIRTKATILGLKYPGIRMLIVRRTYKELERNHITILRQELLKVAKYNKSEKVFTFITGSTIEFAYCERDEDLDRLQGAEYDVIFIDEGTQLSEYQIKVIAACCRGANDFIKQVCITGNPGGQGHAFYKRVFIDRQFNDDEDPDEFSFIQALVDDNKALMEKDPDYVKILDALPPKLRDGWRFGLWDIFQGQFFEEFRNLPEHYADRIGTHVIDPFDIPPEWKIYRSYDFGYSKPFSCGWWAVDKDDRFYRIAELYGCTKIPNEGVKWEPDKQFEKIKEIEDTHPYLKGKKIQGVADPAIWDSSRGPSVADMAIKHKIYFTPGDNARIPGWMQMHYRMAFDDNGIPMMYIFSNCKAFIRTIPLMTYDDTHVEDLDTELEDHVADESRYFCMSRPLKPRSKAVALEIADDPLNQRIQRPVMRIGG